METTDEHDGESGPSGATYQAQVPETEQDWRCTHSNERELPAVDERHDPSAEESCEAREEGSERSTGETEEFQRLGGEQWSVSLSSAGRNDKERRTESARLEMRMPVCRIQHLFRTVTSEE